MGPILLLRKYKYDHLESFVKAVFVLLLFIFILDTQNRHLNSKVNTEKVGSKFNGVKQSIVVYFPSWLMYKFPFLCNNRNRHIRFNNKKLNI